MTNGDFAFFTFHTVRRDFTDRPWLFYDPEDLPRRRQAFYAVKQVRAITTTAQWNRQDFVGLIGGLSFYLPSLSQPPNAFLSILEQK